ncbi:hypothetical protein R2601_03818 [Salipiger bermudensis HTCC2601]|uniref:Uncharacterized protein n=1 Tax=Salipiger bermudensis (strain DSM 26914 / JCM 13377 / KCTC 12554 / HTCC2601) TaxID=314265 RepID=Q0FW82_SALBH|nr:hypothetical protein R2601_03818 [Salipiger bermudensis HTCC2601]
MAHREHAFRVNRSLKRRTSPT